VSGEEKHLSNEQIDQLLGVQAADTAGLGTKELLAEAQQHLAACEACQRLLSMERESHRMLVCIAAERLAVGGGGCPPESVLYQFAGRLLGDQDSEKVMKHIAECERCGPKLRQVVTEFGSERTAAEDALIASLDSSRPQWQKMLAERLASLVRPIPEERTSRWHWPKFGWAYAAIGVLAIGAFSAGLVWRSRPSYSERLLAEAYTERRSFELRIPRARYAPVRVIRGSQFSNVEKPPSLLEAETRISKGLARDAQSADWLQAKGRADLLDGNYDSAIGTLTRALELEPNAPSLLIDLGSAYVQRAASGGQPADYGQGIEMLGRALAQVPDDPVALYNRAIASERVFLYSQAIADWEQYLRVDATGDWAEDARRRLNALRERLKNREGNSSSLLGSRELARALAGSSTDLKDSVDARIEEYGDVAVREWLPEAFATGAAGGELSKESRAALGFLAELALEKHDDPWFSDILSASSSKGFSQAVAALSHSREASNVGDYVAALRLALQAERLFHAGGSLAGELSARVEELYALHLSHDGEKCLSVADAASEDLERSAYAWLQVQFRLEHAMCLGVMGNYGEAQRRIEDAMELAKTRGYGSAYLRGLGFSSDLASTIGDVRTGWNRAYTGLASYWSGTYRPMLGYNLYTDLDTAAESRRQPHLQVAIWDQALALLDSRKDPLLGAMAHSWMAKAALAAGMLDVAEREFAAATYWFSASPQSQATQNDRIEAETSLAELEVRRGDRAGAYKRLRLIESGIHLLSNQYVAIRYYAAMGSVQSGLGLPEAERSLRAAVSLAERSLRTLGSERERSAWHEEASEAYRQLIRRELDRGDSQSALEIWEWFRGATLRNREDGGGFPVTAKEDRHVSEASFAEGLKLPRLDEVASSLSTLKDETVVSYGIFGDEYWIWTYDNRGMISIKGAESASEIESLASRFVDLCSSSDSDPNALRRDGSRLYELLIKPVEGRISGRRQLIVESDGAVGRVPMEALRARDGRYLVDQIPIIMSPGLYYRRVAHQKNGISPSAKALVVAVSVPSGPRSYGMLPLEDAEREAEIIARGFGSAHFVHGKEATLDALGSLMRDVEVFHFAGHAMSSGDGVGLVLADTDLGNQPKLLNAAFLTPERIRAMELAVLSACATDPSSSEAHGAADELGMAFVQGGVPQVVGSRWNVDSASAAVLMQSFYRSLFSGKSVAESLRSGQVAVRSRAEWTHPYFWASFEALGAP